MSNLKPGIFENLVISKDTKVNEKGTLELHLKVVGSKTSAVDSWLDSKVDDESSGKFWLFKPMMTSMNFETKATTPKTAEEIGVELQKFRELLLQYASVVSSRDEAIKAFGGSKPFEAMGLDPANLGVALKKLNKEDFMTKVYLSIANAFVTYINSVKGLDTATFRHKFLRKSKTEAFAVLPRESYTPNFESMKVPKEESLVAFSEWEIKNGKNDATPAKADAVKDVKQDASLFATDDKEVKKSTPTGADSLI